MLNTMKENKSDDWICAHLGDDYQDRKGSISPVLYQSSTHAFKDCKSIQSFRTRDLSKINEGQYYYGRCGNPNVEVLENKIAALERTEACLCNGAGMAAITSVLTTFVKSGDHVISIKHAYGNSFLAGLADKYNISSTIVDGTKVEEIENAITPKTKLIYLESPVSMVYTVQDLQAIAQIAKSHHIITAIDNTWATPIFQKPHTLGIDLVLHSLSKYIGGHSDIIGGAICGSIEHIKELHQTRSSYGNILHPMEAWLALRSIRTLPVRMRAHQKSAIAVAQYLDSHPKVNEVYYPGLKTSQGYSLTKKQMLGYSSLMSFTVDTTESKMIDFLEGLELFSIAISWGGYESLVIDPRENISPDIKGCYTRMFVGLDDVNELLNDIEMNLKKA